MKLLFLNSIDESTFGGMEEWIRLVATGLIKRGHQITVCGRENSEFRKRLIRNNSEVEFIELGISGDFNPRTIAQIRRIIEHKEIETVIVNFNKDIRLGGIAAKLSDQVAVIWSVGLDITKDNLIHKVLTPRLIQGVIVPSQALKNQITRHGYIRPESVKVIPIGIPEHNSVVSKEKARENLLNQFSLGADSVVCVTCGRFVEQKGHEYLIEASREIVNKHPDVVFLLLGDGQLRPKLEKRISELKFERNFILAGMVDNVAELLPGCDLMIHPSIEEPFGIAILEGMRAGLPVVAANVGGISEVVKDQITGVLVEPCDPSSIANAVQKLIKNPAVLNEMGESGTKRWQSQFRYETMIEKIEEYLISQSLKTEAYGKAQADRA